MLGYESPLGARSRSSGTPVTSITIARDDDDAFFVLNEHLSTSPFFSL